MARPSVLTVFGDGITVNDDVDEEEIGATTLGPPGPRIRDPEFCRGQTVGATSGGRRDDESSADGAGQRGGQSRHGSSVLEFRSCVVQQHHAGLDGNRRGMVSGSGDERDRSGGDDGISQHELMYIIHIPDEDARRRALRRYLTTAGEDQSAMRDDDYGPAVSDPAPPQMAPNVGFMIPLEEKTTTPNVEAREVLKTTSKEEVHPGTTVNTTHAQHPGTQVELLTTLNVKTVLVTDIRAT